MEFNRPGAEADDVTDADDSEVDSDEMEADSDEKEEE